MANHGADYGLGIAHPIVDLWTFIPTSMHDFRSSLVAHLHDVVKLLLNGSVIGKKIGNPFSKSATDTPAVVVRSEQGFKPLPEQWVSIVSGVRNERGPKGAKCCPN